MNEMKPPQALSLFDLLGRRWDLGEPLRQVLFNRQGSSVAVRHGGGRLSFLRVNDAEPPESRTRIELETGRMTIRPRQKAVPPPFGNTQTLAHEDHGLCRNGPDGFAFMHASGTEIWRATARGQCLRIARSNGPQFTVLAGYGPAHQLVAACGRTVYFLSGETGATLRKTELSHTATRASVSPNGALVGFWGQDRISVLNTDDLTSAAHIRCDGEIESFAWSPDRRWLAAGCRDKAVLLCDLSAARADRIVDFPAPVGAVDFNKAASSLIASGAFRIVGWQLPDLPFGDHEGRALAMGRPGLTIVETIAAHPRLDLCAAGYANGLVTICKVGHRDEMMVRQGGDQPVTDLAWSDDGAHLAIATADGLAAIVTYPKSIFK